MGESRLKSSPAAAWILSTMAEISAPSSADWAARMDGSTERPSRSICASTGRSGISIAEKSSAEPSPA